MSISDILLFSVVGLAIGSLLSKLIKRRIDKARMQNDKRIESLSQTEEGKIFLQQEFDEKINKSVKSLSNIHRSSLIFHIFLFFLGAIGIYFFIIDIQNEKIVDVIFNNNGYYIASPIMIVYSIYEIISFIKLEK